MSPYEARLEKLLSMNFSHLGFRVEKFEVLPSDYKPGNIIVRFLLHCPCGRTEYAQGLFEPFYTEEEIRTVAMVILGGSASKRHLTEDVEQGRLPPFSIEKHMFTELIVDNGHT